MHPQEAGQQALVQALALVIERYGHRISGGKELFFPDTLLKTIPPTGQVQVERHPKKAGFNIRYFANEVLDIEVVKNVEPSGPIQLAKADVFTGTPVVDSVRDMRGGEASETNKNEAE